MGKASRSEESSASDDDSLNSGSDSAEHSSSESANKEQDGTSNESWTKKSKRTMRERKGTVEKKKTDDLKQCWGKDPNLYGIRRSGRSRQEPSRQSTTNDESDADSGKNEKHAGSRRRSRNRSGTSSKSRSSDRMDSDSGSDVSRPRAKPNTKKSSSAVTSKGGGRRVQLSESSDDSSSSVAGSVKVRNTSRRAAAKVNYREVSDDEEEEVVKTSNARKNGEEFEDYQPGLRPPDPEEGECVEKVMDQRVGHVDAVGACTTVYAITKNGDPNASFEAEVTSELAEEQFLIKWMGWSHLHNTWESLRSLREMGVRGIKRVENYIKKDKELRAWKTVANPEDIEYVECQRDMMQELAESHINVERVIASYDKPLGTHADYLIKWENLSYSECTWEDGALIEERWKDRIEEFRRREQSKCLPQPPNALVRLLRNRPKFVPVKEQPTFLGSVPSLRLRDYQLAGLNWLVSSWCHDRSVILADEMGLGKTVQVICFLAYLFRHYEVYGPFLVVVPLSTLTAWQREFLTWFPDLNVVAYIGDTHSRNTIRAVEWIADGGRLKPNAVLTTYEILLKDRAFLEAMDWAVLVVDEAHRLKNDDSLLYRSLHVFRTHLRVLVTGTPLQNSLKELWALLHFIMPDTFPDWESFDEEHGATAAANKTAGYKKLHKQLQPYILRRVKKDVERLLPAKVEQILRVDMTKAQKQIYKWILARNFDQLRKGSGGSMTTFTNIVVELKKCCNHSHLIQAPPPLFPVGNAAAAASLSSASGGGCDDSAAEQRIQRLVQGSGKLLLLDKLLVRLRETGHRVLIFSQMVRMLDILSEYLLLRHFPYQRLDGSIKGELRRQAMDRFNAVGSPDFCFLLSTRAGGLGINLATADTVIIFDSDWNPQNDLQAQSRAHRIGQKNQVNIYRLVTRGSVEETIVERAKKKMILDHLVIQNMDTTGRSVLDCKASANSSVPFDKEELAAILKFGAQELFKGDDETEEEPACDIDDILRRAETRDEEPRMAGDELLSQFKITSFVFGKDEDGKDDEMEDDKEDEGKKEKLPKKTMTDAEETKDWADIIPDNYKRKVLEQERENEMADLYVRRFLKSWRKFPNPMSRLDSIAEDAELQEKSAGDLKRLGETVLSKCKEAFSSHEQQKDEATKDAKRTRGPKVKIGGVILNAKSLLSQMEDLKPLESLPADKKERGKWQLDVKVKAVHWDCDWTKEDDARLLQGIYEYGMGSWESIKTDPSLKLEKKLLPGNGGKPSEKHLQTRADYLMRAMSNAPRGKKPSKTVASPRKGGRKPKTKAFVDADLSSDDDDAGAEGKGSWPLSLTDKQQQHNSSNNNNNGGRHETDCGK
ncbi:unnamed protein product [Notodromas monacha]|uniref:DNA helicase n=1 Tax=Notodromas monacha TaxID=399045 RepID=A0A7R9G964_9CRUS|nr:unnamed protein product [Notodromas monacha]CAG0913926.1 unnamed protein product [Notodromas monacha]